MHGFLDTSVYICIYRDKYVYITVYNILIMNYLRQSRSIYIYSII